MFESADSLTKSRDTTASLPQQFSTPTVFLYLLCIQVSRPLTLTAVEVVIRIWNGPSQVGLFHTFLFITFMKTQSAILSSAPTCNGKVSFGTLIFDLSLLFQTSFSYNSLECYHSHTGGMQV